MESNKRELNDPAEQQSLMASRFIYLMMVCSLCKNRTTSFVASPNAQDMAKLAYDEGWRVEITEVHAYAFCPKCVALKTASIVPGFPADMEERLKRWVKQEATGLWICGGPRAGKSTLVRHVLGLLEALRVCRLTPDQLAHRFGLSSLADDTQVIVIDEEGVGLGARLQSLGMIHLLNTLVSKEDIRIDRRYMDTKIVHFRGRVIVVDRNLPPVGEAFSGLSRRLYVIDLGNPLTQGGGK